MLAPMGHDFTAALEQGLVALGLQDSTAGTAPARLSYEHHARLLCAWGAVINLTAIREPAAIARRHVCDSLSAAPRLAQLVPPGSSLLDLGSGAGYPGLPLAAALPLARVGLLDSVGKKARFLAVAGAAVGRALDGSPDEGGAGNVSDAEGPAGTDAGPRIEAIAERAEDLAEDADHREGWDLVTARAVGPLAEVVELAMPLVRVGGFVVAWKREEERGGLGRELRDAGSIVRATGGGRLEVVAIDVSGLEGHRLVIVPKLRATPIAYPRDPARRPRSRRST
jgi:16S rRNA (guanine527-N7)-methyltransferase